jgi:hypothetical protein
VVKEGQTVLTRDLDLVHGKAEVDLSITPDLAGTVDINAYVFGRDARPIADHRLIFVEPADELKIEATADAQSYKPGGEARLDFHVTNGRGEGVQAVLGLQVVDEAVFALAEKQPGFAKVFFYLEQEAVKPRYEIHSLSLPDIVEPLAGPRAEQRDRAAHALFAATEMVSENNFQTEFGRTVPRTHYVEYYERYAAQYRVQLQHLAARLVRTLADGGDVTKATDRLASAGVPEMRDPWGNLLRVVRQGNYFRVNGGSPDFNLSGYLEVRSRKSVGKPSSGASRIDINIEHDRGPNNGLAAITGSVGDQEGGALEDATITMQVSGGGARSAFANSSGQFTLASGPGAGRLRRENLLRLGECLTARHPAGA